MDFGRGLGARLSSSGTGWCPSVGSGFAKGMAGSTSNPSLLLSLGHAPPHKTL